MFEAERQAFIQQPVTHLGDASRFGGQLSGLILPLCTAEGGSHFERGMGMDFVAVLDPCVDPPEHGVCVRKC
jgi:hypothetical protein